VNQRQTTTQPGIPDVLPSPPLRRHRGRDTVLRAIGAGSPRLPRIDAEPTIARVYNYLLGGKDHFSGDREFAHRLLELAPGAPAVLRANRDFVGRVVRHLARAHGIEQFIDVGTGLPTQENVHQMAHEVNPDARVVYVDNDPMVLAHARALLANDRRVTVVEGDLRDPDGFLDDEETRRLIDFTKPVAVLVIGVLHFLTADDDPRGIMMHIRDLIAPGSHLAISHIAARPETIRGAEMARRTGAPGFGRKKEEIAAFFDGFEMEPPGLVSVSMWRPGFEHGDDRDVWLYAGLGRTPAAGDT
jgi:SAM-dependent methyltransferase